MARPFGGAIQRFQGQLTDHWKRGGIAFAFRLFISLEIIFRRLCVPFAKRLGLILFVLVSIGPLRTGIFNVADMFISVGVLILLISGFRRSTGRYTACLSASAVIPALLITLVQRSVSITISL